MVMNIYETVNKIMAGLEPIGKDSVNKTQGFKYRGVDAVMNAMAPLFAKYHLFVVPEVLEQAREERTTNKGNILIYSILKMKYTFYAEDGTSVCSTVIGEGMDSGDKATNKAMSIAFKYACFQLFCIPTEDTAPDPDKESHEVKGKAKEEAKPTGERARITVKICDAGKALGKTSKQIAEEYKIDKTTSIERLKEILSMLESELTGGMANE